MAPLSVAVIGARRVRHGTGPFLAQHAAAAGAEIVGVLGTSSPSVGGAVDCLAKRGLRVRGFTGFEAMVAATQPRVVLIASPTGTHRPWLAQAHAAGCHVLCEKPLTTAPAATAERLAKSFAAQGLVLEEVCQWPYTLPAVADLHPDLELGSVTHLRMLLAPPLRGLLRWQEMLSHPLSLLQAILPGPATLQAVRFHQHGADDADVRLNFRYCGFAREIAVEFVLEDLGVFPRPAEFALDGHLCRRVVAAEDYGISFTDSASGDEGAAGKMVACADPLATQVQEFLARVRLAEKRQRAAVGEDLVRRQYLLEQLLTLYREQCGPIK